MIVEMMIEIEKAIVHQIVVQVDLKENLVEIEIVDDHDRGKNF